MKSVDEFLMADMGGTNIRFSVCRYGEITPPRRYKCSEFDSLSAAIHFYLDEEKIARCFDFC